MTRKVIKAHCQHQQCAVCDRTLLDGERTQLYVDEHGQKTVCELCVLWASRHGWRRADAVNDPVPEPSSKREVGNLFATLTRRLRWRRTARLAEAVAVDSISSAASDHSPSVENGNTATILTPPTPDGIPLTVTAATKSESVLEQALKAFNKSEYRRTVAGISRSLGAPQVCVRAGEVAGAPVVITVAWDLCWYRFTAMPTTQASCVALVARGDDPAQLAPEDRLVNAVAGSDGELAVSERTAVISV